MEAKSLNILLFNILLIRNLVSLVRDDIKLFFKKLKYKLLNKENNVANLLPLLTKFKIFNKLKYYFKNMFLNIKVRTGTVMLQI